MNSNEAAKFLKKVHGASTPLGRAAQAAYSAARNQQIDAVNRQLNQADLLYRNQGLGQSSQAGQLQKLLEEARNGRKRKLTIVQLVLGVKRRRPIPSLGRAVTGMTSMAMFI